MNCYTFLAHPHTHTPSHAHTPHILTRTPSHAHPHMHTHLTPSHNTHTHLTEARYNHQMSKLGKSTQSALKELSNQEPSLPLIDVVQGSIEQVTLVNTLIGQFKIILLLNI